MDRATTLKLIAVGVAAYGVNLALWLAALLLGGSAPLIVGCVLLQTVTALPAAVGLWRHARWAPAAIVALGGAIVVTQLIEGPVLGLIPTDRAVFVGAASLIAAIVIAMYAQRSALSVA